MERSKLGQEIYVVSMEKSAQDKLRLFEFVKEGVTADMGAGAGPITELLLRHFPDSKVIAVDNSADMIKRLHARFPDQAQLEIITADVQSFKYHTPIDTMIFISTLHEVFSFNNFSHPSIINTLRNSYNQLCPSGRLIIRDGVQPAQTTLYLRPKHATAFNLFNKFVKSFHVRKMVITAGYFNQTTFVQHPVQSYADFTKDNCYFEMHAQDVSELLSKYFYSEQNWEVELGEQFGIWTLEEYQTILQEIGFKIIHAETYVLPYLLENHYCKDFDLFQVRTGKLVQAPYPPSTMILIGEK